MRVVSFNVGCKELSYFISKMANDQFLSSAEIVFLQEIEEYHSTKEVRDTLNHYGFYYFAASRQLKKGEHGTAILSKLPIIDYEVIELPGFDLLVRSRKRIAVKGVIEKNGQKILICNVHLDSRLNLKDRIRQIQPFLSLINLSYDKVILGGDFNTIPLRLFRNIIPIGTHNQSELFTEFMNTEGFQTFSEQPKYSMRGRGIKWLLDFIYVKNLKISQYGLQETLDLSDHHPIWADIEI